MKQASEHENKDLFWGIRGGWGNFGIVTSFGNHSSNTRSPAEIIAHVNRHTYSRNQAIMFIALIVGILDLEVGQLHFTMRVIIFLFLRKSDQVVTPIREKHGPVLEISLVVEFQESVVEMASNDAFFACTDGVTEAMDSNRQLYSSLRL